jgi:hypothetical protein
MPAHSFQIINHIITYPRLPDPLHEWYWWESVRLYATIECRGAGGEKLTIYYLRPDNIYPYEANGHPNTYDPSTQQASIFKYAWEYRHDYQMLAGSNPIYAYMETTYPRAMRIYSKFPLLPATTAAVPDVLGWLDAHPMIATNLYWKEPGDIIKQFPVWQPSRRQDLAAAFARAWNYETIPWNDTPPDQTAAHEAAGNPLLNANDAWMIYGAYVGHMLAMEIGGRVPWSILSYPADHLFELFHMINCRPDGYELQTWNIPASPHFTYSFLVSNNIIGPTRQETIRNLLAWCRNYLRHSYDSTLQEIWGYYWPPVQRIIEGTTDTKYPEYGVNHYTAGCSGTTRFLMTIFKVVNIPIQKKSITGHAIPYFMTEDAYLSHGDDPYTTNMKVTHPFLYGPEYPVPVRALDDPINKLLISGSTYNAWFGPTVPEPEKNVGRRSSELDIEYFSDYLLHLYWLDKQANLTPPQGRVFKFLQRDFPASIITDLWPAMETRLFALGGLFSSTPKSTTPPKPPKWPIPPKVDPKLPTPPKPPKPPKPQ